VKKGAESLKNALQKLLCPNRLTVPKMRVLVAAATIASPIEEMKNELQEQLYGEPLVDIHRQKSFF
jgi:hypothetical protein